MFADQLRARSARDQKSKPRREKMFGEGRACRSTATPRPGSCRYARALSHRTEPGKHYGVLTAKFLAVLARAVVGLPQCRQRPLLPDRMRPSPSTRTAAARRSIRRSTRSSAPASSAGCNRIARIREWGPDLFGRAQNRWRVIRTSNQYRFVDPQPSSQPPDASKFKFDTGTASQELLACAGRVLDPDNRLHAAYCGSEAK